MRLLLTGRISIPNKKVKQKGYTGDIYIRIIKKCIIKILLFYIED